MAVLINAAEIKQEAQDKERDSRIDRRFAQDVARLRTEGGFRHPATHGSAHSAVRFRLLSENNQDQKDRYEDQEKRADAEKDTHVKGQPKQTPGGFVNALKKTQTG